MLAAYACDDATSSFDEASCSDFRLQMQAAMSDDGKAFTICVGGPKGLVSPTWPAVLIAAATYCDVILLTDDGFRQRFFLLRWRRFICLSDAFANSTPETSVELM